MPDDAIKYAEMLVNTRRNILLVDDDPYIRLIFMRLAERYVCDVKIAPTGEEALRLLESSDHFHLVFVDMKLGSGGMDGMELIRRIVAQRFGGHVVILSGSVSFNDIMVEADRLGIVTFLMKPPDFTLEYLVSKIELTGFPLAHKLVRRHRRVISHLIVDRGATLCSQETGAGRTPGTISQGPFA